MKRVLLVSFMFIKRESLMVLKKLTLFTTVFLVSQGIYAEEYPQDIIRFTEQRDQCDYLRGEISGDPEMDNARNLNEQLDKYCKGTDKALVKLKNKYKNNIEITNKLNPYENNIEPHADNTSHNLFKKYLVNVYQGEIIPPKGYTQKNGIWFDDLGKAVNPPVINFSGKYNIGLHSCGYGCRYYTLTNLADGKDFSDALENFASSPENNTKEHYFIELLSKFDSSLLLARYYKTLDSEDYQDCYFIFKNNKIEKAKNNLKCPVFE